MDEHLRIPVYKSTPALKLVGTGSVRSYDPRVMDLYSNVPGEDDDFGFKSLPEYALKKLFADDDDNNSRRMSQTVRIGENKRAIPSMVITPDSPATVRKKRRAPEPPSGLVAARNKYPSSDDIINDKRFHSNRSNYGASLRPGSISPNTTNTDLWNELLTKLKSQSPSPAGSPKMNRTKTILSKLRSPRSAHKGTRRRRTTSKEDEEAGFKPVSLSAQSSFDEHENGSPEETKCIFFGVIPLDLTRDVEFEVQRIPEYDKYLNELLQETDPSHPDYENLSRAAGKVRHMVKEREDELGNMDNQRRIERVQDKFPHDDLQLRDLDLQRRQLASRRKSAPGAVLFKTLGKTRSTNSLLSQPSMGKKDLEFSRPSKQNNNFNRQYLMEGIVEFSRGMQTQDRYLFLFSDLLLVAKQKSNTTFKLKHRIRVCELWTADCVDDITELTRPIEKSFVIGWPTTNYVATFKSVELKETWLNKFSEQIQEERDKLLPKTLMLDVHHRESDKACHVEVETVTNAVSIVKSCLEQLNINNSEVKDYQLWVRLGPDEAPYPLCGHELPYAIKINHIRDYAKRTDDNITQLEIQRIMEEMENNNRKYEFFLKHKKSQKRQSLEESSKAKHKKKSPLINIFRRNREDKKPQGKLFGHKLADVTTRDNLIAKPIKELMTILFREGPYTVGILRKSCNAKMCKELKQRLDDGEDCLMNEEWPPLVIGSLLKDYLRSIPQSLLMEELFDDWMAANNYTDPVEKSNKLRDTLTKLPEAHYELVRHLICVLYHIERKSSENKMTAFNLSLCIAPSLLWPKGSNDPLATPPALFQYMIENFAQLFGEDSMNLFGDSVEQKMRQDSSTDSDSMHSVLSSHGNYRRDDSSLDSLDREMLYTGDMDRSPHVSKSNHFSPSNLSGDSGLISDQFYDEEGNGNEFSRGYLRSASYSHQDAMHEDVDPVSRSMDNRYVYQYDPQNPVPPPRKGRRKGSDHSGSPNMEYDRKPTRYTSETNFNIPSRYNKRYNQNSHDKFKRRSTESLKSVEESSEADSEMNMQNYRRPDIGTLIKSASGAHLYFEEPQLCEFDDLNALENRRHLYKQSSEGAMPMSPQSKYSLNSSRDSVLSDSSGSYLNRQNSPDPLSSSAETPDQEDRGMSEWLNQQSKHTAYAAEKSRRMSQDDIEVGVKIDRKPVNKINYLVSPKTSPKLRRRSPIPLSVRRSFPLHTETSPKGSGSNTSKEAEDIIKSPKLTVTYCSQDSLDKRDFETPQREKITSPHLDLYNNNSQQAMKQLNIYSSGLQGTSPPPRVLLQGLNYQSQTPRRENTPVKGNHEILTQRRRNSFDTAQNHERQKKYLMEESSVSSEEEADGSDSDIVETRVMTVIKLPVSYNIPQQKVLSDRKNSDSSSRSSSCHSDDNSGSRPENPPTYDEAVQRSRLLKQGLSPEVPSDTEVEKVKQASLKAKQLYEQSMKQYQEQSNRYSLPSQLFEKKLDIHEEHSIEDECESSSVTSEEDTPEYNPRKLYEESLKRYLAEQSGKSPLVKTHSGDGKPISISSNKGGNSGLSTPSGSKLHRSSSDAQDLTPSRNASPANRSSGGSSRDSTPTKRPDQPPPYNDPPPYRIDRNESSPHSVSRHLFPRAAESNSTQIFTPKTENCSNVNRTESSTENAQQLSVPKRRDNILVSNKARNVATSSGNSVHGSNGNISRSTDYSVHSAQNEIGQYRSIARGRNSIDSRMVRSSTPNSTKNQSDSVFRPRASSLEPQQPLGNVSNPRTSSQGPVSYRNPDTTSVATSQQKTDSPSFTTATKKVIKSAQKDLPWSVKRLSNIFDASKPDVSESPNTSSTSIPHRNSPVYTPPTSSQRYNDNLRSSTSSASSYGSTRHTRTGAKSFNKFGPQSQDSFSSTDESDCSCRYSLNCRRDNSSLEELTDVSFTDITFV
ncbi:hypothetical protein ACF0H5_008448 [Mactra antiquata]